MQKKYLLGCVADDFTGASDAASFLQSAGMKTVLLNEIPKCIEIPEETDAIVVALKSRTEEKGKAVSDTLKAIQWMEQQGVAQFYFKYCSTFDSTKEGNIGPVADALMEYFEQQYTILCPSLPVNGRIVKGGILYVNGVPLDESPMKNHPLTPMRDGRIKNLIEAQSKYCAEEIPPMVLNQDKKDIHSYMEDLAKKHKRKKHFYLIPDYVDDYDGLRITDEFGDLKFLTGGSGILAPLAAHILEYKKSNHGCISTRKAQNNLKGVIFAGSCSIATQEQVATYQELGKYSYRICPEDLLTGKKIEKDIIDFVLKHADQEVLIYSSDTAENVKRIQKLGKEKIAELIEVTISHVAVALMEKGYGRFIVAGGETCGAVTKALGFDAFEIGDAVAPGVPVLTPMENKDIRLVLKSGNFGNKDFFAKALKLTKGE